MLKHTKPKETWTRADVVKGLSAIEQAQGVADGMAQDWYKGLVYNAIGSGFVQVDHNDKKSVKELWSEAYEKEFKTANNAKTMPSAYRSAKSVVCKAIRLDVELLNEDGTARGKTDVEKECNEKEANDKSNVDKITTMLGTVSALIDKARDEGESLTTVQALLADLHAKCS